MNTLRLSVAIKILIPILLIVWLDTANAEALRRVTGKFSTVEIEQQASSISFSFYESAEAPVPFLIENFAANEFAWEEIDGIQKVTALISTNDIQAELGTWYQLEVNGKQVGNRQKLLSNDPSSPDFSVEGYIETRSGGIKFADQTTQTTAVDPTNFQQRVNDSCAAGSSISGINQDGTVTCQADTNSGGDITGVSAGSGLTGGGLNGDVSLAVDTAVIQQRVATACPAGQSIRSINQDGSILCVAGGSTTLPPVCNGSNQALQFDGTNYSCVDIRQLGASAGTANGFEISDTGNETWDGFQRPNLNWADANAACESLGGRLPTITELYRNNATTGSGNLSNPDATESLWTLIAGRTGFHASVRLSDGLVANTSNTQLRSYRCVWPNVSDSLFTANNCYTDNGSCEQTGLVWNLDTLSRPPMSFMNAVNECNFYGASVPSIRDMSEYIHQTAPIGDFNWNWSAEAKYIGGNFLTLYRWNTQGLVFAYTANGLQTGSAAQPTSQYAVRCIGKNSSVGILPTPSCEGGCFQLDKRQAAILADSTDRPAELYAAAAESCRLLGGSLPDNAELNDIIRAGLSNGSNSWLWSSDPLYANSSGTLGYRWTGTGEDDWNPQFDTTFLPGTSSRPYRCIWNEKFEATPTVCAADQAQSWDGTQFTCSASTNGTSNGSAAPLEFLDAWGNAWDLLARAPANLAAATDDCSLDGGRLPTATEIYRLRANQAVAGVQSIGSAGDTAFLWTNIIGASATVQVTVRVSDGDTNSNNAVTDSAYRCIWPAAKGDVLAGRSCYSEPANGCYQSGDLRTDNFDRASMAQASASNECEFYGGRLPDLDEFQELIHSGAANGTNNWLWINEPINWPSGNYGYALGRWVGSGDASWLYNGASGNGSLSQSITSWPFRCIFSNRLD